MSKSFSDGTRANDWVAAEPRECITVWRQEITAIFLHKSQRSLMGNFVFKVMMWINLGTHHKLANRLIRCPRQTRLCGHISIRHAHLHGDHYAFNRQWIGTIAIIHCYFNLLPHIHNCLSFVLQQPETVILRYLVGKPIDYICQLQETKKILT